MSRWFRIFHLIWAFKTEISHSKKEGRKTTRHRKWKKTRNRKYFGSLISNGIFDFRPDLSLRFNVEILSFNCRENWFYLRNGTKYRNSSSDLQFWIFRLLLDRKLNLNFRNLTLKRRGDKIDTTEKMEQKIEVLVSFLGSLIPKITNQNIDRILIWAASMKISH